jgi:ComF family protein
MSADFYCSCCRAPFLNAAPLDEAGRCPLCRLGINRFDAAYSYGAYEGKLRELIHLFKYGGIRTLVRVAVPPGETFDAIVPAPLHWTKLWQRGFNQARLLALELSRRTGAPLLRALRRRKATRAQAGLTRAGRRANVAGAFAVSNPAAVAGLRLLLVDDVMTTGATMNACAAALKRAGARRVAVLTLARADRRIASPDSAALAEAESSIPSAVSGV